MIVGFQVVGKDFTNATDLVEGSRIDLNLMNGEWDIVAVSEPSVVDYVEFFLNGDIKGTDVSSPYSLCSGASASSFLSCANTEYFKREQHALTAITIDNASAYGHSKTIKFSIVNNVLEVHAKSK